MEELQISVSIHVYCTSKDQFGYTSLKNMFEFFKITHICIHTKNLTSCQQMSSAFSISTFTFVNGFIVGFWKNEERSKKKVAQCTKKPAKMRVLHWRRIRWTRLYILPFFCQIWWFFKVEPRPEKANTDVRNLEKSSNKPKFWEKMKKGLGPCSTCR